jgi:GNAT superfamily N-acetyltransferase
MYTHPDWARKGVGSFIMMLAEQEAKKAGYKKCELMATKAGEPLYKIHGYKIIEEILYKNLSGLTVPMMKMEKDI